MNRRHWLVLLALLFAAVFCCCLFLSGWAAFFWQWTERLPIDATDPPVSPAPTPTWLPDAARGAPTPAERQTAQLVAKAALPERDLLALAQRLQDPPPSLPPEGRGDPPAYELGDVTTFWLHDLQTTTFFTATARLSYVTPHAYWWIEEGYRVSEQDLERSALNFEDRTYPTNHRYFGYEWTPGIDGDPHIYVFLGNVPGVGGYFSGPDEYPTQVRPYSNEHEMFYINLENTAPGNDYFDGILAHEFQHMIHWAMDRNEDSWVNEGLSELAGQVNGYDPGGAEDLFGLSPDTQLNAWVELEEAGPHYGASYLFATYFLEQYGEAAIRRLVAEPANGIAGIEAVLADAAPAPQSFEDLFADWVIANYVDDPSLADGRLGYTSLDIGPPAHAAQHTAYPAYERASVHQYAADYVLLESEEGANLTVEFTGTRTVPLVGNEAHSGVYQWWSNRGDDGDATLTRAFDLTGLEQATLQAWMWYDLETDYDYAYVQVSTDGGQTWDLLANEHTTTTNPSGNSYGPGFTGLSGGGDRPVWSQETFDLTPYTGQSALVRFEVITDEALNRPGLALDDIAIPELGYAYDVEEGGGGWQAAGWLRVTDHIPQRFLVQLITFGRETRVARMPLDERMQGALTIAGLGREVERAVLVISALAPVTTEWATYEYRVSRE